MREPKTCRRDTCFLRALNASHGYCYKHAKAAGVLDPYVPAASTQTRIQQLVDQGWTLGAIAKTADLDLSTVWKITHHYTDSLRSSTARKIHHLTNTANKGPWVPAWPTTRRLRSPQAAGWTQTELADAMGITQSSVSAVVIGKKYITREIAEKITDLYAAHASDEVRPPARAARKHGWVTPAWWDNIDDPEEKPGVTHCLRCHTPNIRYVGKCRACYDRDRNARLRAHKRDQEARHAA